MLGINVVVLGEIVASVTKRLIGWRQNRSGII